MPPRLAVWHLIILLLVLAPVFSNANSFLNPDEAIDKLLKETILGPPPNNQSAPPVCDYLHQAWAHKAIRVKIEDTQFKTVGDPEPCAEKRTMNQPKIRQQLEATFVPPIGYVGLPFRRYSSSAGSDLHCTVFAGTFIRDTSSLYSVIKSSPGKNALHVNELLKRPASKEWNDKNIRFYVNVSSEWNFTPEWIVTPDNATGISLPISVRPSLFKRKPARNSPSLFLDTMNKDKVPEYAVAVSKANSHHSTHQERLKELSPSNTAILLLPMLLSFLPASALTDALSANCTLVFAIATDFITNIPVFIKGAELLYISSLQGSGTGLSSLLTDVGQVRFVEIWFTQCSKTLRSFRIGFVFVFLAIWSTAVGFATEFLIWKFNAEKRGMGPTKSANNFARESLSRSTVFENEDREPFRKRLKIHHSIAAKDASRDSISNTNVRKRRHSDMVSEADSEFRCDDNDTCGSNWKENVKEYAFFVVGVALSFVAVLPFLGLAFLRHPFFKKTKQRERFFMIGTIVGAMNIVYIFLGLGFTIHMDRHLCFLIFVLLFDLVLPFFLGQWKYQCFKCLPIMSNAETEPTKNEIQESRETRFYLFGLLLGLLLSVLSTIYLRCFPWVRGYKRRRGMLKMGCMIGTFTSFLLSGYIFRAVFHGEIPVLLFNLVFIVTLVLLETDLIVRSTQDELPDMI